ncbi:MAG: hypothetical protein QXY40_09180 [Candidatus Methanomethylicia archaeon]
MLIYASSPLSVSISGEWVSILGEPQISLAISKYVEIWVKESLRSTIEFQINSIAESTNYTTKLLRLIESMLMDYYDVRNLSFTINIPLDLRYGLGCISALCTALLASTSKIYNISINEDSIIKHSKELEEKLFGYGSSISSILALTGGIVAYREEEGYITVKYKGDYNIVIGASDKAFVDVLRICKQYSRKIAPLQSLIKHSIGHATIEIADCFRRGNVKKLYEALNASYMLQSSLFKIPPRINRIISSCRILGAYAATLSGINKQYVVCLTYKGNDRLEKFLSKKGFHILPVSISKRGLVTYEC